MLYASSIESILFNLIQDNLLYCAIILSAIIGNLKERSKNNMFTVWTMYLIGTLSHEIAHLLLSLITFGKPSWFSVFPSKQKNEHGQTIGYVLGYVESKNITWYNSFFIAMAPLLLMPLSYWVYMHFFEYFDKNIYTIVSYIFIIISLMFNSIPSATDFKHVFNKNIIMNLIVPIFVVLYYIMYAPSVLS